MPRTKANHDQAELVKLAIAGIDAQVRELEEKRASLLNLASGGGKQVRAGSTRTATGSSSSGTKKRVFSAATRKRLSLAAKRRWARARAAKKGKAARPQ